MEFESYACELAPADTAPPPLANTASLQSLYAIGLHLDTSFQNALGFSALKPDAKVIMAIGYHGDLTIKQAMLASQMSYRGFYIMLDRLVESKLVEVCQDSKDRRVRRLRLCTNNL
jgi:DNA-binding MarR family transcriptional regulator